MQSEGGVWQSRRLENRAARHRDHPTCSASLGAGHTPLWQSTNDVATLADVVLIANAASGSETPVVVDCRPHVCHAGSGDVCYFACFAYFAVPLMLTTPAGAAKRSSGWRLVLQGRSVSRWFARGNRPAAGAAKQSDGWRLVL